MFRFRLQTQNNQVELVANGHGHSVTFQGIGPITEVAFIEELIDQEFGSLTVPPASLFVFLQTNPWIKENFREPVLVAGDFESHSQRPKETFHHQPLGEKLVKAGVLNLEELDQLLLDYQPFSANQRFGEFLRLNLKVSEPMLDLLMNPELYAERGFNDQRLGERLCSLGLISDITLNEALSQQQQRGGRLGTILAQKGVISEQTAQFFSEAHLTPSGEIEFNTSL